MAGLLGTPLVLAMGRDSLCYLLAILTLLWAVGWWLLVRESPAEHPRLSAEQRHHLQRAIGPGLSARNAVSSLSQTDRRTQSHFNHLAATEPSYANLNHYARPETFLMLLFNDSVIIDTMCRQRQGE
jgi:hypothetical protein